MTLRPIKSLGQNFLVDPNTKRRIVDQLEAPSDARVVEIGPGPGALTELLVDRYEKLSAVEIDRRAVESLRELYPQLDVIHLDILDIDYQALSDNGDPLWIIGNLPYNITSQILFGLLDAGCIRQAVITIQREVAERLVARPRTKAYGILSVQTQLFCDPKICFHISPNVFRPKPDVWSSTVRLNFAKVETVSDRMSRAAVSQVIRTAFNQRRKTLRNSLKLMTDAAGIDLPGEIASKRAEELSPYEYVELARILVVSQDDGSQPR